MFALHDRMRFELFCITTVPSTPDDTVEQRIRASCEHWIDASDAKLSYEAAAIELRRRGIDVLVDLNGWTKGRRTKLFAHRPAPIQMLHAWVSNKSRCCCTYDSSY
jgi:protein O-GlcNAc transferase